jgi:xanthine dehydrogenase YagS FAD-binding subunit
MHAFEYATPKTVKEAVALLGASWADAAVLAGGTDLISLMKDNVMTPKRVVSLKDVAELKGITKTAAGVRIGALATVDDLLSSPLIRASFPALTQAATGISSAQIRNMGTVGGDLCQRPRCWYFRAGFGLIATHEGKNLAAEGDSRFHAIFGDGPAHFVSASSFGPALISLGAQLKVAGASGVRTIEAAKFFVTPANSDAREIALLPNEILTEIEVPAAANVKNATYEVRQKDALDWPLATASVALTMKGASVASAKIVLGHVAPTPYWAADASKWLEGKSITRDSAEAAAKSALAAAKPLKDNNYKVQLAAVAVKRALMAAAGVTA